MNEDTRWIIKEHERINSISNPEEKQKQMDKLDRKLEERAILLSKQYEINRHSKLDDVEKRGILIQRNTIASIELRGEWERAFTSKLSTKEKKNIYFDSFLWHVFSYEKIICKKNDKARAAFNNIPKECVVAFYENEDEVLLFQNAGQLIDTDFDLEQDIYIADLDFTWTYVVTHEKQQCGPYFYMTKNEIV